MIICDRNTEAEERQFEEAAEWVSTTESGRFAPEDRKELDFWLTADSRNASAFIRMQYILVMTAKIDLSGVAENGSEPQGRCQTGFI